MVVLGEGRFLMSEVLMYSVRECVHTVLHTKETVNLETSPWGETTHDLSQGCLRTCRFVPVSVTHRR